MNLKNLPSAGFQIVVYQLVRLKGVNKRIM